MAGKRNTEEDDVSLFPFLSILSCVIGVLTLLITAMAISQMDTPEIVETEFLDELVAEDESLKQEIATFEQDIRDSSQSAGELLQAQDQLAKLVEQLNEKKREADEIRKKVNPDLVPVDFDKKIKELEADKKKLDTELTRLEVELGDRKDKQEGIVKVRPGGSGVNFQPVFVECRKEGIVLYTDGGKQHNVLRSQLGSDVQFLSVLDGISDNPAQVMTFLLRQDGVDTYYQARNMARSRYAKNGKLPVLGNGKLDLSLFMKKGGGQ